MTVRVATRCFRASVVGATAALCLFACSGGPSGADPSEAAGLAQQDVIFGDDNRVEPFGLVPGSSGAEISDTSLAIIDSVHLDTSDPNHVKLVALTQQTRFNLCPDERFVDQPSAADCSATLVAPDLVVTAGHCVGAVCSDTMRFVRGYRMANGTSLEPLTMDKIYSCRQIVARRFEPNIDFAVVRLDRPVAGVVLPTVKVGPLPLATGQHLVVAGYPEGMPEKIIDGATIVNARARTADYFLADLDSFPGNSGSGVFVAETGELAGVLVRGPNPGYGYLPGESCTRPERTNLGSGALIESTYIHHAIDALCAAVSESSLCACGNGACEPTLRESTATCAADCGSVCGDNACNGSESADSCYADCGYCGDNSCELDEVARMSCPEDCGCPPGLWPVRGACVPVRGNTNGDEHIDLQDALALRGALEDPRHNPVRGLAADVDCDGIVNRQDARALESFIAGRTRHLPCETIASVAAGYQHTCAVTISDRVRCWGDNNFAQLGVGSPTGGGVPTAGALLPVDLSASALQISAGAMHTCALLKGGLVTCWGDGGSGKLGYGSVETIGNDKTPKDAGAVALGALARAVATGGNHSCAILHDGSVRCWGNNEFGQLGYGSIDAIGDDELPSSVAPLRFSKPVVQLALGFDHTCALTAGGEVYCWGENFFGQLGRGTLDAGGALERGDATEPVDLGGAARSIAAGVFTTCAVRVDGRVYCWGDNTFGQLGNGDTNNIGDDERPVDGGPVAIEPGVEQVALGRDYVCALFANGDVKCWGDNSLGQLGYGHMQPVATRPSELEPLPLGDRAQTLSLSSSHACAVVSNGSIRCWGGGSSGQLGYGNLLSVGADNTPQTAGDVPMEPIPTAGWKYQNRYGLEVWMRQSESHPRLSEPTYNQVDLVVVAGGNVRAPHLRAFYDYRLVQAAAVLPKPDSKRADPTAVAIEPGVAGFYSAIVSLNDDESRCVEFDRRHIVGSARFGLQAHSSDMGTENWQDDYSAFDGSTSGSWYRTQRIQVVDAQGNIVSGWTTR